MSTFIKLTANSVINVNSIELVEMHQNEEGELYASLITASCSTNERYTVAPELTKPLLSELNLDSLYDSFTPQPDEDTDAALSDGDSDNPQIDDCCDGCLPN